MSLSNIYNPSLTHSNSSPYFPNPNPQPRNGMGENQSSPELIGIDEEEEVDKQIHQQQSYNNNNNNNNTNKYWNNNTNNDHIHSAPVTPKKNPFSSTSTSTTMNERPSPSINLGGRKRLTKIVGQDQGSSTSIGFDQDEERGGKKRKSNNDDNKEEEGDNGNGNENEEDDGFDPMASIHVFNSKAELENEWDQIQKDLVEFLKTYAKDTLEHAFQDILQVNYLFTTLNKEAQTNLLKGVEAIEKEEGLHETARKIITDFSNEIQRAAQVLSRFGHHDNPIKAMLAKREETVEA